MKNYRWEHLIPIVYAFIAIVMMLWLIGCGNLQVPTQSIRQNETSGWVAVGLYRYDDGMYLIERYEANTGWRSFELFGTAKVSSHFIKFAEGYCMEARSVTTNTQGTLTNQTLTLDDGCYNFNIFYERTRGKLND